MAGNNESLWEAKKECCGSKMNGSCGSAVTKGQGAKEKPQTRPANKHPLSGVVAHR